MDADAASYESSSIEKEDDGDLLDITFLIEECSSSLSVTDPFVCNTASFSLHDAMAATQLMDSKMDCCQIPACNYLPQAKVRHNSDGGEDKVVYPRPVPTGLDDAFSPLPWDELTMREATYITLEMLVRFQAFLSGTSVGESTFTCLYAHADVIADMRSRLFADKPLNDPIPDTSTENYPQFVVFACALGLVELTDVVRGIILNADIYEEEDFAPNTYEIPFYSNERDEEIATLHIIQRALEMTSDMMDGDSPEEAKVILFIFGIMFGLLSVCGVMGKISTKELSDGLNSMQGVIKAAVNRLDQLDEALSSFVSENDDVQERIRRQVCDAFVNRPRVGNTPVRKPVFRTPKEAVVSLRRITSELDWAMCDLLVHGSSLARIQRILDGVQRSEVNILCRSLIILNLYFEEKLLGQHEMEPLIFENMRQWTEIPDALLESEHAKMFVGRLAKPIYDTLKLRTLNRCRQRAYIESVMLTEWISLQSEARIVDVRYQQDNNLDKTTPPYFSQYVLTNLLRVMDRHLSVGFEMGIFYGELDVSVALWYRDFLLSALLNNLMEMRRTKVPIVKPAAKQPEKGRGKRKNSKTKPKHSSLKRQQIAEEKEDEFEIILISVERDLCRGLKRFIAALQQANVLRDKAFEFTSPKRVFDERFEVFGQVTQPPQLTYQDYLRGSDYSNISPTELLTTTAESFQSTKKTIDQLLQDLSAIEPVYAPLQEADLRSLLKVCIGNSVYLHKLRSLVDAEAEPDVKAVLEFEPGAHFCTIKLSQITK